jgi:hypothetical protein
VSTCDHQGAQLSVSVWNISIKLRKVVSQNELITSMEEPYHL